MTAIEPIVYVAAYGALIGTINILLLLINNARSRRDDLVEQINRLRESVAYIRGRTDVR